MLKPITLKTRTHGPMVVLLKNDGEVILYYIVVILFGIQFLEKRNVLKKEIVENEASENVPLPKLGPFLFIFLNEENPVRGHERYTYRTFGAQTYEERQLFM